MKFILAAATVGAAQAFVTPSGFSGQAVTSAARVSSVAPARMSLADYKEELAATAKQIAGPGKEGVKRSRHFENHKSVTWFQRWCACVCCVQHVWFCELWGSAYVYVRLGLTHGT